MSRIIVGQVYTSQEGDKIKLSCDYNLQGNRHTLWFTTQKIHKEKLSVDNCDSFFVILTLLAIKEGRDITFESPVSYRLYHGFKDYVLPTLLMFHKEYQSISIEISQFNYNQYEEAHLTGTALSLGVDSFFTIQQKQDTSEEVDVFTLFNAGAFGERGEEEARGLFQGFLENTKATATKMNIPLIAVDTNLNEVLDLKFIHTHTFRNLACVLLFQKAIRTYFYSAAYHLKDFKVGENTTAGDFDLLYTAGMNANKLTFKTFGLFHNRLQKTKEVAKSPIVQAQLNVCLIIPKYKKWKQESSRKNCSRCPKCARTMVTLDVLGELEKYDNVFDLDIYKENKNKYLAELLYAKIRMKDGYAKEIFKEMKRRKYKYSSEVYKFLFLRALQPFKRRALK